MNGVNGVGGFAPPSGPVVEALWTAPQFSVSPGFNDDFNRLLGAQTRGDHQPAARANSNSLHQYSISMNEDLGLSPIPYHVGVSPHTPLGHFEDYHHHHHRPETQPPPTLEPTDGDDDRRKQLIERGRAALEDWRTCKDTGARFLPTDDEDQADLLNATLELKLREAEETIASLNSIAEMYKELTATVEEKDSTIEDLRQQLEASKVADSTADVDGLREALRDAEERAAKAAALAEQKSDVASTLAIEVANLQTALDATGNASVKDHIHTNNDMSMEMEKTLAEKIKAEKEVAKWQTLYQESYDKNLKLSRELDSAKAEINSELSLVYEDKVSEMNIKLNEREAKLRTALKEKEDLTKMLEELRRESLTDDVAALNAENERLAEMLQEREVGDIGQIVKERDALQLKVSELLNAGPSERISHLEGQVLKLTAELAKNQEMPNDVDYVNSLVARNEQLESRLSQQSSAEIDTGALLRAKQKEKEWVLERERWVMFQKRAEAETERQRMQLQEYEDAISKLKEEIEKCGGTVPELTQSPIMADTSPRPQYDSAPPPALVPEGHPPPPPTAVPSDRPIPPPPTRLLSTSSVTLPLSVIVFEAIFSLGGLLPSTRHAQHAHLTGEFKV